MRTQGWLGLAVLLAAPLAHAQEEPRRGLPPADQPLIKRIPQPKVSVEGGAGVIGFLGGGAGVGPAWNVRVTGALGPRFALEGNYMGSVNQRSDTGDTLVMTAFDAGGRYNFLLPDEFPVQPFMTVGIGYAGFAGNHGDPFTLIVLISAGAERMLTSNVKFGARFAYRPTFFDDLGSAVPGSTANPGADTWTLLAQLAGGF